ncbi:MAG: Lrp/AsnC family transcriptional regulator [Acidimicrobiales bacterium]
MYELDTIDRRLVAALEASPRAGMLQLARVVGVARNTAQAHLDRMMAAGVITGFGPDVDLQNAGYGVSAWLTLEISQGRSGDIDEHLGAVAEVVEAYMTTGPSDLLCRVVARDNDHLGMVVSRILEIPGITRTTTSLVLATRIAPRVRHLITDETRTDEIGQLRR